MREIATATQSGGLMNFTCSRPIRTVQFVSFVQLLTNQSIETKNAVFWDVVPGRIFCEQTFRRSQLVPRSQIFLP
jgi:hypothetical protein